MKIVYASVLISSTALATSIFPPSARTFTIADYDEFVKESYIEFNLKPKVKKALNNNCGKPVLAALTYTIFQEAMNDGVDLPESIDVVDIVPFSNLGAYSLTTYDNRIYIVVTDAVASQPKGAPCVAMEATFSGERH